jgi:putative membrane protein insertion efficiency factor
MSRKFFIAPIKAYQFVSRMLPASCRYYPTCSEYAIWQFEFASPQEALLNSTIRILRCNPFFAGGIEYPQVKWQKPKSSTFINHKLHLKKNHHSSYDNSFKSSPFIVKYWIVPNLKRDSYFFIIKDLDATKIGN